MSGFDTDLRSIGAGINSRLVLGVQKMRRTKSGPALVRLTTAVAAFGALAIAMPAEVLLSPRSGLALPFAIVVGLFPRTRFVTIVALLSVLLWLITTIGFDDGPPAAWRIALLAAALYVMHTGAALGAVLPYDSIVAPGMLLRWAGRTVAVLGASLVIGFAGMAFAARLTAVPTLAGPIVGAFIAAGLAGLLAWHLRRR